jgi:methyl-accepting chemotaxis protein
MVASEITHDITEVSTASINISDNSKEVESNAQDLLERSNALNTIVGRFRI